MNIQTIRKYYNVAGKVWPTGKEALDFVVTELGEAMDAWIRQYGRGFKRNNPDKETNLEYELGDVYMMAQIASHELTGKSLEENAKAKLASKGFKFDIFENVFGPYKSVDQMFQEKWTPEETEKFRGILKDAKEEEAKGKNIFGFPEAEIWGDDKLREGTPKTIYGLPVATITKKCQACEIETEENPHPVPVKYHTCKQRFVIEVTDVKPGEILISEDDFEEPYEMAKCAMCGQAADGPYYCPEHK